MKCNGTLIKVILSLLLLLNITHATTWFVHPDSTLNTIQAGLDSCSANDSVLVGPSTYLENLVWPDVQSIVLMSELGPDTTIIDGDSSGNVIYIDVEIDSTTIIEGFTIQNGYSDWAGGIVCDGVDIFPASCSPTIINNTITGNTYAGIACQFSSPRIIGNTIIGNAGCGIFCYGSWPVIITSNHIIDNTYGIAFDLSEGPVSGNTITGNLRGISCVNAGGTFIGNIIKENYEDGVHLYDSYPIINHCTISSNSGDGIDIDATHLTSPEIHYNNITDNSGYGIRYEWYVDVIIEAEYNWWGDPSGPGGAGPGIGDEVSSYVDYDPWLTDSVGVEEYRPSQPVSSLLEISPNPFRDKTDIRWQITDNRSQITDNSVGLKIYDIAGRIVKNFSLPTAYSLVPTVITWHGRDNNGNKLPNGVYFLKFTVDNYTETEKLLLLR